VIDHSVSPNTEHGNGFENDYDRADRIHRVCTAWDFAVSPIPSA
jgi:hypothetical protein